MHKLLLLLALALLLPAVRPQDQQAAAQAQEQPQVQQPQQGLNSTASLRKLNDCADLQLSVSQLELAQQADIIVTGRWGGKGQAAEGWLGLHVHAPMHARVQFHSQRTS